MVVILPLKEIIELLRQRSDPICFKFISTSNKPIKVLNY
jgi:hypothetical protein